MDAIKHLPPLNSKGNRKIINLVVIRVNLQGKLKNSKPCFKCIEHMARISSYKLKNVYYSDDEGNILMTKFKNLLDDENKHVSKRFRNRLGAKKV